jgi:REP element-mobilizing transposase RayT
MARQRQPGKAQQTAMPLLPAGRGGWRPGAGRKAKPGARVLHRTRGNVPGHCPVHVTVRLRRGIPSLRRGRFVRALRRSLCQCSVRAGFRVVHYSIQKNHLHFLIEAQGKAALGAGMKSLSARIGRCVNRVFERSGRVLDGRYHHRVLTTPREVRNALAYVLLNARHHFYERNRRPPPDAQLDPASSAAWFDGWRQPPAAASTPPTGTETAAPRSWLLRKGWRRHRLIDPAEVPGAVAALMGIRPGDAPALLNVSHRSRAMDGATAATTWRPRA